MLIATLSAELHFRRSDASGMDLVDRMPSAQFKRYVATYLERRGYWVEELSNPSDTDFFVRRNRTATYVHTVRSREGINLESLQQALAAAKQHQAESLLIVTNSGLWSSAESFARANRVQVWGRSRLMGKMARAGGRSVAVRLMEEAPPS